MCALRSSCSYGPRNGRVEDRRVDQRERWCWWAALELEHAELVAAAREPRRRQVQRALRPGERPVAAQSAPGHQQHAVAPATRVHERVLRRVLNRERTYTPHILYTIHTVLIITPVSPNSLFIVRVLVKVKSI